MGRKPTAAQENAIGPKKRHPRPDRDLETTRDTPGLAVVQQPTELELASGARRPAFAWALPPKMNVPKERAIMQLTFYPSALILTEFDGGHGHGRLVAPDALVKALFKDVNYSSGMLPANALWWSVGRTGAWIALYREPQVWKFALQLDSKKPARRLALPMPGLIFICHRANPANVPYIYAVKQRPTHITDPIYYAPCFNVFRNGKICSGSHRFPEDPSKIPESFFTSFFAPTGDSSERSSKHPVHLGDLWNELDGKETYPNSDLVQFGTVGDIMNLREDARW